MKWPQAGLVVVALASVGLERTRLEASSTPGAWRGASARGAVEDISRRARQRSEQVHGWTVEHVVAAAFLDNAALADESLVALTQVRLEQLADPADTFGPTLAKIPDARARPSHRFTVAVLAALTGVDAGELSLRAPGLGMTGAPSAPFLFAPTTPRLERSTSLHDVTDYLRGAGVPGVNRAVWGIEGRELSALVSFVAGAPVR